MTWTETWESLAKLKIRVRTLVSADQDWVALRSGREKAEEAIDLFWTHFHPYVLEHSLTKDFFEVFDIKNLGFLASKAEIDRQQREVCYPTEQQTTTLLEAWQTLSKIDEEIRGARSLLHPFWDNEGNPTLHRNPKLLKSVQARKEAIFTELETLKCVVKLGESVVSLQDDLRTLFNELDWLEHLAMSRRKKRGGNRAQDLTGQVFGKWTVLRRAPNRRREIYFDCRCECGIEKEVAASSLRKKSSTACMRCNRRKPVEDVRRGKPEYSAWLLIRRSCYCPRYPNYRNVGAKGIKLCERWHDSRVFLNDVGKRPSPSHCFRRIDPSKDYEPGNVQWTRERVYPTQIHFDGQAHPLRMWAEIKGLLPGTLRARLYRLGWTVEEALTTPTGWKRISEYPMVVKRLAKLTGHPVTAQRSLL